LVPLLFVSFVRMFECGRAPSPCANFFWCLSMRMSTTVFLFLLFVLVNFSLLLSN
jgi:hypothetical protein